MPKSYEIAVIPMYLLIVIWGSTNKQYAAMKLTLYLLLGSALMFAGFLYMYSLPGSHTFDLVQIKQNVTLATPFKGDAMMSRSGALIGTRVAGETKVLGYSVDKITRQPGGDGYRFSLKQTGRICMPGNKANFSFDERFLVTHHYLTREDFESDAAWNVYKGKGASDIYLADFVTGTKTRITRMMPGQFALFPHFRSDGWIYFIVRDANTKKETIVGADSAIRATAANPS